LQGDVGEDGGGEDIGEENISGSQMRRAPQRHTSSSGLQEVGPE